ncbi:response regulator transcription factor [Sinorhizobium terangae]|uniref:response regulator transcription factor n=1 Tax=Sinorhizobium terangae TaxID=110322 RepID=UPI0012976FDF|nr:response regulator transcription factor [Sinorhizobium terangae]MBB4189122.1 DNA-binding NarL/FixJ family response regulator [Sinorhizobium terangae]WFU46818.1 response regulator transcription factor [Sinorhizobium terangae]
MDKSDDHASDAAINLRVIVVDDHLIVLDGLRRLIETVPGWQVVATCQNAVQALDVLNSGSVDVVVLDLRMPEMSGLEFVRRVRRGVTIVILTADIGDGQLEEAMQLGVSGIVLKEQAPVALLDCIRKVVAGGTYFHDPALKDALDRIREQETERSRILEALTQREIEVSRLAAMGMRSREIGTQLGISTGTVKLHLHSIYSKLGISTRVELANLSKRLQLNIE